MTGIQYYICSFISRATLGNQTYLEFFAVTCWEHVIYIIYKDFSVIDSETDTDVRWTS